MGSTGPGAQRVPPSPPHPPHPRAPGSTLTFTHLGNVWRVLSTQGSPKPALGALQPGCPKATELSFLPFNAFSIWLKQQEGDKIQTFGRSTIQTSGKMHLFIFSYTACRITPALPTSIVHNKLCQIQLRFATATRENCPKLVLIYSASPLTLPRLLGSQQERILLRPRA